MIRPRGGNFEYTDDEFSDMKQSLAVFLTMGADGFVFGILKDGFINTRRCGELVELAKDKPCTFHRAFDELVDMETGLRDVISCGFRAVLTSGGKSDAVSRVEKLKALVSRTRLDESVDIIVGGGVRASNITSVLETTTATWFHSSALLEPTENALVSLQEVIEMKKALAGTPP